MGNQASTPSPRKGGKQHDEMITKGFESLVRLQKVIHETYPFLVEAEDSACLVDLRLKDQPLLYVNDAFLQLTLYPREEIIGRNCRFLQGKYTNRETVRKVRNAISQGEGLDVELLNYRKDGMPFWNNFLLLPVWEVKEHRETGQNPTHFIAIQKDVTFLKPHLTDPNQWTTEALAVFCDSVRLPRLAEFIFGADLAGSEFLAITQEQLELADLPLREFEQAGQLVKFLKENPGDVSTFLSACRFSQTNGASLFQSMMEQQKNEHPLHTTSTGSMDKILAREKGRRGSKTALRKYSGPIGKLPKDTSGESISFWGVEGNRMESVTVKVNVLFGSKSSDEVRTVVILLYLSRDFTLEELKSSLFQTLKTTKYTIFCVMKNLDLRIDNEGHFLQAQELSNKWRDSFSFKIVVLKRGKFKRLQSTNEVQQGIVSQGKKKRQSPVPFIPDEEEQRSSSPVNVEPDLVSGILSNPSMTVHLIETTFLDSRRMEIYELIYKWYYHNKQISILIDKCIGRTIATTHFSDGAILFRSDQGCLSFVVSYCDKIAGQFRSDLLAPFITAYLQDTESASLIKKYVGNLLMTLIKSVDKFPPEYRELLTIITTKVNELPPRFKHYAISSFLFLRFLCPALVVPAKYGVAVEEGVGSTAKERKRLVALASFVQQVVSQFTEGQEKSPFSFEMGVLYSKITKSFAVSIEMDEIQRTIKSLVSHHDLLTAKSTFEKTQRDVERAGRLGVDRMDSLESFDETSDDHSDTSSAYS